MLSGSRVSCFLKSAGLALSLAGLSILTGHAQSVASETANSTGSSSAEYRFLLTPEEMGGSLAPALPAAEGQYGGGYNQPSYRSRFSHLAVEGGGGFTAPLGNSSNELTYGYNFRGGLGWNFARHIALLGEYEFDRTGIPGPVLAQVGEPGGNVHIWSLTLDPVWYYKNSGRVGGYVTGGGGFYRRLTSFTEPVPAQGVYCDYFYCYPYYYTENAVVSHYSSNQGGLNIGTGLTFGSWDRAKFFAEARYEWIDTPGRSSQIIPVTFGLRW